MANKWLTYLKAYRKKHPGKSMKECLKAAAVEYRKIKGGGDTKKAKKKKAKK